MPIDIPQFDSFELQVAWIKSIFLTQDRAIVQAFKTTLTTAPEPTTYRRGIVVAICSLADTHPSVFAWVLHNYTLRTLLPSPSPLPF